MREEIISMIEDIIASMKINKNTDLWDNILLDLLEKEIITEEEAEELYNDKYLNDLLHYTKINRYVFLEKVYSEYYKDEHESYYRRSVL